MFGQFTGQKQPDGGLDLAGADGRLLVVVGKAGSFGGDALEDVVDKRIHDAHGFAGDTSVRMNLLQHLVDVDSIAFLSLSPSLLLPVDCRLFTGLLLAFLSNWSFWCHLLKLANANERSFKIYAIYTVHTIMSGSKSSLFDWITAFFCFPTTKKRHNPYVFHGSDLRLSIRRLLSKAVADIHPLLIQYFHHIRSQQKLIVFIP